MPRAARPQLSLWRRKLLRVFSKTVWLNVLVEHRLTHTGFSRAEAFCSEWMWAEEHLERIETARATFDAVKAAG